MTPTDLAALFSASVLMMAASTSSSKAQANPAQRRVAKIKAEIVTLARSFAGQGDKDFSRQKQLQPLVDELLSAAPQPPVKDRVELLSGAWRQIWGPYDYRTSGARGIDPDTIPDEIYQVVFPGGYYWNVTPQRGSDRIALLRGRYAPVGKTNFLKARFTRFPGKHGTAQGAATLAARHTRRTSTAAEPCYRSARACRLFVLWRRLPARSLHRSRYAHHVWWQHHSRPERRVHIRDGTRW